MSITTIQNGQNNILFDGIGEWKDNSLTFSEINERANISISLNDKGLLVRRKSTELETILWLLKPVGKGILKSEEGTINIDNIEILQYSYQKDFAFLKYKVDEEITILINLGEFYVNKESFN